MIQSSLYRLCQDSALSSSLILTKDSKEAQEACDLLCFVGGYEVFALPEMRVRFGDDMSSFRDEFLGILGALRGFYKAYNQGKKPILIAPLSSVLYPLPKPELLQSLSLSLSQQINQEVLKDFIIQSGYEVVEVVELEGEVSFRGDIIDIFMPNAPRPHRIAFFDDEIESIREFELISQMSIPSEIATLELLPALFSLDSAQSAALSAQVAQGEFEGFNQDIASFGFWLLGERAQFLTRTLKPLLSPAALEEIKEIYALDSSLDSENSESNPTLESSLAQGNALQGALPLSEIESFPLLSSDPSFSDILFHPSNLTSVLSAHSHRKIILIAHNEIVLKNYDVSSFTFSFVQSGAIVNLITPHELILSLNTRGVKKRHKKPTLKLNEISLGEYVVHSEYGIGVFKGIKQAQIAGVVRDFIEIAYQGEDKLLLPVENLNMIDRYVADSGAIPMVDRLGKGSFAKLKAKVRTKLLEIANGIIELAAKRNLLQGAKINTHKEELALFASSAGFALTPDQSRSISEIFRDLESGKVMDRLLSGDVGFGKTEVAMNAMYATYLSGYQSAMFVPTTLLSSQHFHSLTSRLESYGVRVARCDRFLKPQEKTALFKALKEGKIDIVVGTHALLGAEFQNLGLLVVDEEHKFGVKQKEKIKELSANTHLLSMSATPIPRTLNMALSQIKSLSSLQTPPVERIPVRTFIKKSQDSLLKEIIMREIRRGGQVFYIHNNIASIERKKDEILRLLPKLKIATLHSQVDNAKSEEIILSFAKGEYNMLLCTSIVESGIHLPNANTIIIAGADRFGIADLHQLRGRVGRGSKEGFCYFVLEDLDSITDEAKKRLSALEKNSYLGSGENLAYYDLEIRGGGNLLGEAQSGHIKNIGYGLYLRMLEECINFLSGKGSVEKTQCDLKLNLNAYLNPTLISSDTLRLELYRRLSLCEELSEVTDIESEIYDRFGRLDNESSAFMELIRIKVLANKLGLKQILHFGQNITFITPDGQKESIQAPSKDWDDVARTLTEALHKKLKAQANSQNLGQS